MKQFLLYIALMLTAFGMAAQDVESLYIIGNDPFGNWNPTTGIPMEKDESGLFYITVDIPANCYFSFTQKVASTPTAWDEITPYRLGAPNDGFAIETDLNGEVIQCNAWGENVNNAFMTLFRANYEIYVDPTTCEVMFAWVPDIVEPDPEPDGNIYILGEVNGYDWAANEGLKMNKVNESLFTATVTINKSSAYFNFTRALALLSYYWSSIYPYRFGAIADTVQLNDVLREPQQLGYDQESAQNYFCLQQGTYKLHLDLGARTLWAEAAEPGIYLVGTMNDWNPQAGIAMETDDGNTYTYTANLSGDIYFVFTNTQDRWNIINNGEHRFGPANGEQRITAGEDVTSQLTGDTGAYIFDAGAGAEYSITFDLANRCFRIDAADGKVGDVNGDEAVDGTDLNILINIILGKDNASNYDGRANVDGTGEIDGNDLNALINILLGK